MNIGLSYLTCAGMVQPSALPSSASNSFFILERQRIGDFGDDKAPMCHVAGDPSCRADVLFEFVQGDLFDTVRVVIERDGKRVQSLNVERSWCNGIISHRPTSVRLVVSSGRSFARSGRSARRGAGQGKDTAQAGISQVCLYVLR